METVDARGLGCPKPIILAEEALGRIKEGMVVVFVDNEESAENLKRYAQRFGYYYEVERENSYWKVKLVKGFTCNIHSTPQRESKKLLIIITSHILGFDEVLGKNLMKAFFETMIATKQLPNTIFLMNTAVRLSTTDEEFIEILKNLEELGVEIFTCGTCLKYFNIEDKLRVGYRGTTNHFVEGMMDYDKTIWLS